MRSYKAARRAALKEPVEFEVTYDKPVHHRDDSGVVTGTTFEETTERFTCRGDVSSLLLSEMAAQAGLDAASAEGMALLRQVFWQAFGDDAEYQRFFRVAARQLDDDELFDIMRDLIEDLSGRPTRRPSDSPGGPSTTGESSKVVTLPGGFRTEAPRTEPPAAMQQVSSH